MHNYKFSLTIACILIISTGMSQTNPPPMSMPDKANSVLVDSLIRITNHEHFFIEYCSKKVTEHAATNNWPQSKTERILKSIKFKYYDDTIYNSYAWYSTAELRQLLDALLILNRKSSKGTRLILTNSMMQSNLDLFVKGLIEGKYVMSSD